MENVQTGHDDRREAAGVNSPRRASAEALEIIDFPDAVATEVGATFDPTTPLVEIGVSEKQGRSTDRLAKTAILMKRYSYPEDVVGAAAFPASPESDCATGQLFMIDGGMVMPCFFGPRLDLC